MTTVGYGDIATHSTEEKIFRIVSMIIGVIMFTLASSTVLDCTISESINIFKQKDNEYMIEKIQYKYELKGDSKR